MRRERLFFLLLGLFGFLMSLGPRIHFFGRDLCYGPYILLRIFIPGYDRIRAIGWMAIDFVFAAAVLAGMGYAKLAGVVRKTRRRIVIVVVSILILVVEYSNDNERSAFWSKSSKEYYRLPQDVPEVYSWLKRQPGKFGIMELPAPINNGEFGSGCYEMIYAIRALYHGKRIANGYGSYRPPHYWPLIDLMGYFPCRQSLRVLQAMGLKYIILHTAAPTGVDISGEDCPPGIPMEIVERAGKQSRYLKFARRFGTDYVFELLSDDEAGSIVGECPLEETLQRRGWSARADIRGEDARLAIDGNPSTSWSTFRGLNLYNNNHSFTLDLGRRCDVSCVEIWYSHSFQYPRGLSVAVSADGENWNAVDTMDAYADLAVRLLNDPSDNRFVVRFPNKEARFIRFMETLPQLDWSISEIKVFGTGAR